MFEEPLEASTVYAKFIKFLLLFEGVSNGSGFFVFV